MKHSDSPQHQTPSTKSEKELEAIFKRSDKKVEDIFEKRDPSRRDTEGPTERERKTG